MKTSHSDALPGDPLPEDPGERQELVPALAPEQEPDPSLVALVRNLVSRDLRLQELPNRSGEPLEEEEKILADLEELQLELHRYTQEMAVAKKVDRYTSMLTYLEYQRDALTQEIQRLTRRKRSAQSIIDRMLGAAHYALSLLPQPRYGPRELEGTNSSLALVKNPGHVRVIEKAAVPPEWRRATIKMNLRTWLELWLALPPDVRERMRNQYTLADDEVILSALAPVLKAGTEVAGVEWVRDERVERR